MKFLLIFFIFYSQIYSKSLDTLNSNNNDSYFQKIWNDLKIAKNDGLEISNNIINPTLNDFIKISAVAVGTGVIYFADNNTRRTSYKINSTEDKLFYYTGNFGNLIYPIIFSSTIYGTGLFSNSIELRTTGRQLFEALAMSGIITTSLKYITGRSRPYTNDIHSNFRFFQYKNEYLSFPSGHTTVAFAFSTIIAERINRWWASVFLYGLSCSTGYSRIYYDQHWLSDVFLGACVGYFSARSILNIDKSNNKSFSDNVEKESFFNKIQFKITLNKIQFVYIF